MAGLATTLLVLALITAVLGFGGLAAEIAWIVQIFFFVFLVLFLISLTVGVTRRRVPPI